MVFVPIRISHSIWKSKAIDFSIPLTFCVCQKKNQVKLIAICNEQTRENGIDGKWTPVQTCRCLDESSNTCNSISLLTFWTFPSGIEQETTHIGERRWENMKILRSHWDIDVWLNNKLVPWIHHFTLCLCPESFEYLIKQRKQDLDSPNNVLASIWYVLLWFLITTRHVVCCFVLTFSCLCHL